jgi:Berberine and berberine like
VRLHQLRRPTGEANCGANYDRLVEVKRAYDPDNPFHLNQNIVP